MPKLIGLMAVALALAVSTPAQADWMRAETKHFVVYENAKPEEVRILASDLERFDGYLRLILPMNERPGAESNKLSVYVVPDVQRVQKLYGGGGSAFGVYGFYDGRASGSVVFTPRRADATGDQGLDARKVLFHEYGHHFLLGGQAIAYPAWYSEGFAEFVSTTLFTPTAVKIGIPAYHRGYSLLNGPRLPARVLFDPSSRKRLTAEELGVLYGRGWLFTHWLFQDGKRADKMRQYLSALNSGTPSLKAATDAFGNLDTLDHDLDRYLGQSRMSYMSLAPGAVPDAAVAMAPLSPGAQALMDFRLISTRGVDAAIARGNYAKAAPVAARFPDDALAQSWFAEIATDAGEDAVAEAAADRALALDPQSAQALIYKGLLAQRRAAKSGSAKDWTTARTFFIRANKLDPDKAWPLELFYASFEAQGMKPRDSAIAGLYRAQELVPQDEGLRVLAARQLIRDARLAEARRMLAPVAYNPHLPADNPGTRAITALDAGDGAGALKILNGDEKPAAAAGAAGGQSR